MMMLKNIIIENFKSWKKLELKISSITGLFGPNSSGKSSLLQFLLLLKQTKETLDRSLAIDFGSSKSYANLGAFRDVIFFHDTGGVLKWNIKWTLPKELEIIDPLESRKSILFKGQEMSLESAVALRNQQPSTNMIQYRFSDHFFALERKKTKPTSFSIKAKGQNTKFRFIRNQGRVWDIPGPVKSYAFPDQAKTYYQNAGFLGDLEYSYEELMDRIFYLGPLREYPKREYVWSGSSPIDVGHRGERVVDALLAAQSRNEKRSLGYRKRKPEIHLHPAVQSGLADVIINAVQTRNIQVIFESHSEHLLRRLQRRVAEGGIKNTNISLYFSQNKSGNSHMTHLQLNLFGKIDNWPKDFFGDEFAELAVTRKGGIKPKR
jgi:energy-coupling factor transporter ATP-binding protein EcfA2